MKHLQTIILSLAPLLVVVFFLKINADQEIRTLTANQEEAYKIDAALKERIDMLYRAHSDVEFDLETHKERITALENRPQVVPFHWHAGGVVHVTNGMIDIKNLGTPVRPNAEEQAIINETLK